MATALVPFPVASFARGGAKSTQRYDLCAHPFHSWKCLTGQKKEKEVFSRRTNSPSRVRSSMLLLKPNLETTTSSLPQESSLRKAEEVAEGERFTLTPWPNLETSTVGNCSNFSSSFLCETKRKEASFQVFVKEPNFTAAVSSTSTLVHQSTEEPSSVILSNAVKNSGDIIRTTTYSTPILISTPENPQLKGTLNFRRNDAKPESLDFSVSKNFKMTKSLARGSTDKANSEKLAKSQTKNYDKCSHPFHAWLCSRPQPKRKPKSRPSPSNVAKSLLPKAKSKNRKPLIVLTTPKSTKVKSIKDKSDMCSHAFHSWLCQMRPFPIKASNRIKSTSIPAPTFKKPKTLISHLRISTVPTTIRPKLKKQSYNKCKHVFHSWLCEIATKPKRKDNRSKSQSLPIRLQSKIKESPLKLEPAKANNSDECVNNEVAQKDNLLILLHRNKNVQIKKNKCVNEPRQEFPNLKPKASFARPNKPRRKQDEGTRDNLKEKGNNVSDVRKLHPKASWDGSNPCNHAFHSWICGNRGQMRRNRNLKAKTPEENLNFRSAANRKTFVAPISTTLSPVKQEFKNIFKIESKKNESFCRHSFHRWMCDLKQQKVTKQKNKK